MSDQNSTAGPRATVGGELPGEAPPPFDAQAFEMQTLRRLARRYEALARAECRRQGIAPDELISDHGDAAWELVGYEAAKWEMPDVE